MKTVITFFLLTLFSVISIANPSLNRSLKDINSYSKPIRIDRGVYGMSREAFKTLKTAVVNEKYDNTRKSIVITASRLLGISSIQMREVLKIFQYDSHRLETAKKSASHIIDRENGWIVGESFQYSSSEKEFLSFLNSKKELESFQGKCYNHGYNIYGMGEMDFQELLNLVKEQSYDNNKIQKTLDVIKFKKISSKQILILLKEFNYDSHRLEAVKKFMPFIADASYYWMVVDSFQYSSSKRKVLGYIDQNITQIPCNKSKSCCSKIQYCKNGMDREVFKVLKRSIVSIDSDYKRTIKLSSVLKFRKISSSQIKELLGCYDGDYHRYETAKNALSYISDLQNYWIVSEEFESSYYKTEFINLINEKKSSNYGSLNDDNNKSNQSVHEEKIDNYKADGSYGLSVEKRKEITLKAIINHKKITSEEKVALIKELGL